MHETALRNGVLIYLSTDDHKFAIIGDKGINDVVTDNFWQSTKQIMLAQFKEGQIAQGLIDGIQQAGQQLKKHFPYQKEDVNELSDEISYGS